MAESNTSLTVLPEGIQNSIENIAFHLAQQQAGHVFSAQVACYLPLSIELIGVAFEHMNHSKSITSCEDAGLSYILFSSLEPSEGATAPEAAPLQPQTCVHCQKEPLQDAMLCPPCLNIFLEDCRTLSEQHPAWIQRAQDEHEIWNLCQEHRHGFDASQIAGHSSLTLERVEHLLEQLTQAKALRLDLDVDKNLMLFHSPRLSYPKLRFQEHQRILEQCKNQLLHRHDQHLDRQSSKILIRLSLLVLCCLSLALMRMPTPMVALFFIISAPLVVFFSLSKKSPKKPSHSSFG